MIPISVRDIELYMNWEKLFENLNWVNELGSKIFEANSKTIKVIMFNDNYNFLP